MKSEQGNKTAEKHLQPKIYNIKTQFESPAKTILRRDKKRDDGDKKCVTVDSIIDYRLSSNVPLQIPQNVNTYEKRDVTAHWHYVCCCFVSVFCQVLLRMVQCGGETKDGERKSGNAQNHEKKEGSQQCAGGGGHSGHSGPGSTSTSGSSSGGDGGDGRGNDDWKIKRDSLGDVNPEHEEAEQNEEETGDIEEAEKNEQTCPEEKCIGRRGKDGNVYRSEKTGHSTVEHREQEQESAVQTYRPLLNNLRRCTARRRLISCTRSDTLCSPLQQFPFRLTYAFMLQRGLLLPGGQDILRRWNIGLPGFQRFTVHVFLQRQEGICSVVIIADTGLLLDQQWLHNLQNYRKGLLYWVSLILQRSTSRGLERGQSIPNAVMSFSQTTNSMQTIFGRFQFLVTLNGRLFTVFATQCPQHYHQFQCMTSSSAEKPRRSIRRTPEERRAGSSRQTGRPYRVKSSPEKHAVCQLTLSRQNVVNRLQTEPLPLKLQRSVHASDAARHYTSTGHLVHPSGSGAMRRSSPAAMGYPLSLMDSGVGHTTSGQQLCYSRQQTQLHDSVKFPSCPSKPDQDPKIISGKTLSPGPSMSPVQNPCNTRGRNKPPSKGKSDPWGFSGKKADTGTTKPPVLERESTFHPDGCSAIGATVSPTRGYPGPPTPSCQDRFGNRERRGAQDHQIVQQVLPSSAEGVGGAPNRSSGFDFSSPYMELQSNSLHAEGLPNTNPGLSRRMQGFAFEPGDGNEHKHGAQGYCQAQYRPQRGGRRQHPVFQQCSEDLTFPRNSSSDHAINRHRPETTVGPHNTPQQQHFSNQGELPFPTPCKDDVHLLTGSGWGSSDTANPSAALNYGIPHENTALPHGGPVQQGIPAPNNYDRCQVQLRECTLVANPAHMTEAELERRLYDLIAENRRLRQAFMCQICLHQPFTCVFDPCGHKACDYCSSILCECCICKEWIRRTFPASFR